MAETQTKYSICTICDIGCQFRSIVKDGKLDRVIAHDNAMLAKNICYKGTAAPHIHNHAERLRVPLKRVGERGRRQVGRDQLRAGHGRDQRAPERHR